MILVVFLLREKCILCLQNITYTAHIYQSLSFLCTQINIFTCKLQQQMHHQYQIPIDCYSSSCKYVSLELKEKKKKATCLFGTDCSFLCHFLVADGYFSSSGQNAIFFLACHFFFSYNLRGNAISHILPFHSHYQSSFCHFFQKLFLYGKVHVVNIKFCSGTIFIFFHE